jgi:hypothetical protein
MVQRKRRVIYKLIERFLNFVKDSSGLTPAHPY